MNIRGVQGSSLATKAGLSPMVADPRKSSTHSDPARDKIKSRASEKISMLQKKQLQVMTDWQMKNDEEVASAYRTADGRVLMAGGTVGSSQLFDDLPGADMSIQRVDKEHRVPGTQVTLNHRPRDSTDDYGHPSTDQLHSESFQAPKQDGAATENAASSQLAKDQATAGDKLAEELCNRDLTHVRARYASSAVEDSPNQAYQSGHSRTTNTGKGLSAENPYDVAYAPIQEQVYAFHERPQTALNHSTVVRQHRRHIQSAKLNDFHSRYNKGARYADHKNVAKALDVRSIHDSLRELKEFFAPASRAAAAQLGLLTNNTSQAVLSELNPTHDAGRRSANNASSHASLRAGTRAYKVMGRPLRSCLARNCKVESTAATEQFFEEQMKRNYNDFLIQKKSKQLDLLDLLQLLILDKSGNSDAEDGGARGSPQAQPPAASSLKDFPISIHDTYMVQVSRKAQGNGQRVVSTKRRRGKQEAVAVGAAVASLTHRITESTTSLEKVVVESLPSSAPLRQRLKEILERYVQVTAGQEGSIDAETYVELHMGQVVGCLLGPRDRRKAVTVKHLSSTAEFEALCSSMVPKKEADLKSHSLALQVENAGVNTQRASALVGQWLAIQEYEYKGQVEGKGHIDKLFSGLISKQVFQQLVAEGKRNRIGQYVVSIDDQRNTLGSSINAHQVTSNEYQVQQGLKDLEHVLRGPTHGPAAPPPALFYKRSDHRATTPGTSEQFLSTAPIVKSKYSGNSAYAEVDPAGADKGLPGAERTGTSKPSGLLHSILTQGPQYTTGNWSLSSKESTSQLLLHPYFAEELHAAALSSFDVNFSQHSRKLIQWIQSRVSQLFDEQAEDARVKVKRARFIYEIGITRLRLAGIENIHVDFEIPDTAKPAVADLKKRIKINLGRRGIETEKEATKAEVKKMIEKGEASVSSTLVKQEENSLDDQLGGINRAALYEGLKAVGLNYGKTEKYRQPIAQRPSSSSVNFVRRQQLHAKRQHKLNLERKRVTPSKSPSSHSFLTNYPQFMDKQGSSAHSKFLFGQAQSKGNGSLLKKYKSLVGRREASDRYFIMGKDGMMRSENLRQENLITKKGKESIFGGLVMSEYNSFTESNNDLGAHIAKELGKTRQELVKQQVARDMFHRVMSGQSSDGDRESAYHLYMSRARDVNSIPKNLQVEMNRSLLDESMALSTSFKELQDVSVLDKRTQKQIQQEVRRKLKRSEEELRKSRTSESMMLIAAEFEARPANPSYYMYQDRDRYAKNQDIKDQIRLLANPKEEQARLAALEYGKTDGVGGGGVECDIPIYYGKIEIEPLAPYMTREASAPDLKAELKNSEVGKARRHMLEVSIEKRSPAPRLLPSAKVERSTASLQSQGSKSGSTHRQQLYGYSEVAIGIQGRQVKVTAQQNAGGRRREHTQESEGGLLAETTTIRARAVDGGVETLEVATECLASLLAKVTAHQCGGQITIGTTEEQQNGQESTVDVEVPGFDQLLKFSVSAFLSFCQVSQPTPPNANPPKQKTAQQRVKKLQLRNDAIQSTRNNQIPLSNQLVKSNESVNSRSSRKVILSNHNVSSQVLNRMHESVCSEKSGSPAKRKPQQATDENGLAILQMESADSLTMFDRLPIGTHRGPTGATEALLEKAPNTQSQQSQIVRNQNERDIVVGGSYRHRETQGEGTGLVNEASIFDNLIIKSSSRERAQPQFQQTQKQAWPANGPSMNKEVSQKTDSPTVTIPKAERDQSPYPTNGSARDDYRPQVSRQIKKNADPNIHKPLNSSQKRQHSASGRKSCTLSAPSRENLTANMDYAGIGTGASPKDATPHAAQSKKSLSIVEIMQQTMAEDVGKKPGSQKDPTEGGTIRNTPARGGLDEPFAAPTDVARQAVHNLEISRQSTTTKVASSWQHLDRILVLKCNKCQE